MMFWVKKFWESKVQYDDYSMYYILESGQE